MVRPWLMTLAPILISSSFRLIVLQNTAAFFSWADLRIAQLVAFSADSVLRHYRPTRLADRLRRTV